MRYSLRNQSKIEEVFGTTLMLVLEASIAKYFRDNSIIPLHTVEGEKYPIIQVPNAKEDSDEVYELYVYDTHFDVLNLAYKPKK